MSMLQSETINRLRAQLFADKKKSALLGVLLLIFLVVFLRAVLSGSKPDEAVASGSVAVAPAAQATAHVDPVQPGVRPAPQPALAANSASTVVSPVSAVAGSPPGVTQIPALFGERASVAVDGLPRRSKRDPFGSRSLSKFPRLPDGAGDPNGGGSTAGFWTTILTGVQSQGTRQREEMIKIAEELAGLELQSTITGAMPLAYVSGRVVRPGDTIAGFSVVRIEDRRIVVRKSGITRVLTMQ